MKRPFLLIAATAALAASTALAQGPGYGPGYGPGMMGGYGGAGMMRGYGAGPGMMGGYGAFGGVDLSDEQQDKLFALQEQNRTKNFATMTKMRAEMFKLRKMVNADNVDSKAVLEQQKKVDDLRREMLASRLEMRKQMEGVLTAEQRKQLRRSGPWWAPGEED